MGVQGLWKLLESTGRTVNPETLEGKIVAVDISIWLNQAVKGARDRQGNAVQNAHLLTLFHRLCKLLFFRIRPIFVFDGEAPGLKKRTLANRRQRKNAATEDSTKTTEKLLKTFLKRQAIKAVLTGKSDDNLPSLSHVRREEVDDIYLLPALEEKEKNSSDEEEEKEWEERMTQRQLLQEEFIENPHSVDIESEDFMNLPPEVKHEILTDLKELTKRRRTIFETMPEESNDFSSYQLKGLLKKNTLNRHIKTVQKEMNQQNSGDIQALYENEGGFLKNVESKKVMSEDASHYVLIKGLQSKNVISQEDLPGLSSSLTVTRPVCKEITEGFDAGTAPPSLVKPEKEDSTAVVAPPSPRTLMAIEAAMMEESSSDEDTRSVNMTLPFVQSKVVSDSIDVPHQSTSLAEGNVSPRTMKAIQQALNEDAGRHLDHKWPVLVNMIDKKQIVISSSDEETVPPAVMIEEKPTLPVHTTKLTNTQIDLTLGTKVLLISSSDDEDLLPEIRSQQKPILPVHTTKSPSTQTVELNQKSVGLDLDHMVHAETIFASTSTQKEPIESQQHSSFDSEPLPLPDVAPNDVTSNESMVDGLSFPVRTDSVISSDLRTKGSTESTEKADLLQSDLEMKGKASLLGSFIPTVSSSRKSAEEKVSDEAFLNEGSNSESDDSFIEVDSDLSDHFQVPLEPVKVMLTEPVTVALTPIEAAPTANQDASSREIDDHVENAEVERVLPVQREAVPAEVQKDAVNEWHDISLEELETLESNLLVQQGTLQAQKQQQERIAATVTGQMYLESQELLRLFGVPYIVAPTEAEAQCAILDLTDQTSGTITDDSDIWLFGARHVYKNFFSHNKYVEYYQYVDIHNQLGLDRNKLINLAYLLGSDYTDGIPTVGCVTAMEILNEFPGHGLQPLIRFRDWWAETQKNKKIRPNPNDTKVKKKLRELELHESFPNLAVAEAYLKPVVDDSKGAFSWGRPDLEQIREFCANAFGWYRSKTDDILLPVLKQLNAQQTQLRIDSFFRMEQREKQAIKSQRLRRAVTCMRRKEKEEDILEMEEPAVTEEEIFKSPGKKKGKRTVHDVTTVQKSETVKRKKATNCQPENVAAEVGGFLDVGRIPKPENESSSGDSEVESANLSKGKQMLEVHEISSLSKKSTPTDKIKNGRGRNNSSSSSGEEEEVKTMMVTARPVFESKVIKTKGIRGRKKKK
ncbi:DNA excision repair protein ERCC-5 [Lissotriton helveticus]